MKRSCEGCNCPYIEFLGIDHIDGGGAQHRKQLGYGGSAFYYWLIRQDFPPGYQVLCHNCNMSRGFFGYCPHNKSSRFENL